MTSVCQPSGHNSYDNKSVSPYVLAEAIHAEYFNSIGSIINHPERFKSQFQQECSARGNLDCLPPCDIDCIEKPKINTKKRRLSYYYTSPDGTPRRVVVDNLDKKIPSICDQVLIPVCF